MGTDGARTRVPHVVLVALGTVGDLLPFLAAVRALQARGHRVSLLAQAVHAPMVAPTGLDFHPLGSVERHHALTADPALWRPRTGFALIWRGLQDVLAELEQQLMRLADEGAGVVLAHPLALPACDMARAARPTLRVVAAYLAPANLRSCHDPLTVGPLRIPRWVPLAWRQRLWARVDQRIIDPAALPLLNARRIAHGLPPVAHFMAHLHGVADASVAFFPPAFAATPPDWPQPLHQAGFPQHAPASAQSLPVELVDFLGAGPAPVVFTPGTGHRHAAAYFRMAVRAAQALGLRALLLTPYREQVPEPLPPGVAWHAFVPLPSLLPQVQALVHHGGIGTVAAALRAAVPQLVVPFAHDQFDNAARVETLGAGRTLRASRLSERRLRGALRRLLADADRHRAAARTVMHGAASGGMQGLFDAIDQATTAAPRLSARPA